MKLYFLPALGLTLTPFCVFPQVPDRNDGDTVTPIKHLIVVIGENHSFDNVFGAYRPRAGVSVANLLSRQIINADGTPGAKSGRATQRQASDAGAYSIAPRLLGAYPTLPVPALRGRMDTRYSPLLPSAPYQITNAEGGYDDYFPGPVHRFFQMWQSIDTGSNDLFAWVGVNAARQRQSSGTSTPLIGGEAMGFFNMSTGDAPVLKRLADGYALSDNYHQSIMGGSGANFLALVTGDVGTYRFTDFSGRQVTTPPRTQIGDPENLSAENEETEDEGSPQGVFVKCADPAQPGVRSIRAHLAQHPNFRQGNCAAQTYYAVNNIPLAFQPNGRRKKYNPYVSSPRTLLPPQSAPTIADALTTNRISWKYYSGGRLSPNAVGKFYCDICDPLVGFESIMRSSQRNNLQGLSGFARDVQAAETLPAIAFVRPNNRQSGHPGYSRLLDFEKFVQKVIGQVRANRNVWEQSAILILFDEGGGYYDSGYIQPIDFFGDGTRVPLLLVSPWAKRGYIDHDYADHASILKFIERNWDLPPLSPRSRDNLPNPVAGPRNIYQPANAPAISDLFGLFEFN